MIVNLIVIALILLIGFHYSRKRNKDSDLNRKRYIKTICFILILQSGLRNVAVGTDTYTYFLSYEDTKNMSWDKVWQIVIDYYKYNQGKDPGYTVFEKLVSLFTGEYQLFLFAIAILFFTALGQFIYKNTDRLRDAMVAFVIYSVLFYSFFSITGHRQTIATAGTLFAFEFLKKRKLFYFLLIILIASTIHKTSLVFIPLYFITYLKKPNYYFWIVIVLFPVLLLISNAVALYIFSLTNSYEEYQHMDELKPVTFVCLMLLISVTALVRYKKIIKLNPTAVFYYFALMIGIVFLSLVFAIHGYMRIVQYFSIFIMLLIPLILRSFNSAGRKIELLVYFCTITILLFFFLKSNFDMEYKFFWEEMRLEEVYL
ncbi:hypothetical protein ASG38_05865 [Flavobacterium sp. Leaf359]|uniref:EpsG family protein n=1 Tax=Flavobacterium sp. Leaf359 TaxID=1736351 RepID=UPI0006F656D6|nr:EpsG family protein [Flavobacterium sp. Leaf359]KQS48663.1 hypothetical protein ASG38_05865 [Flavobacterium sp. Leaf359]